MSDHSLVVKKLGSEIAKLKNTLNSGGITDFEQKLDIMVNNLFEGKLSQLYQCRGSGNQKILDDYAQIISRIGLPKRINAKRLSIPTFSEIQIQKTDTKELKAFIRKINFKTQTYECDHNKTNKKFDCFEADTAKIYISKEMKEIEKYFKCLARCILRILRDDENDYSAYNYSVKSISNDIFNNAYGEGCSVYDGVEEMRIKMIAINAQLTELEYHFKSLECWKCKKISME
jgi:hypothetical protein